MNRCGQYLYETAQIMVKQNVQSHDRASALGWKMGHGNFDPYYCSNPMLQPGFQDWKGKSNCHDATICGGFLFFFWEEGWVRWGTKNIITVVRWRQ